ncbi:hypothetical protein VOLCADRAFT_89567 [Volvox carteri f. nagariensis]|uniref:SOUL heme-binding protein n=1 Tax=Volvox carteri f. nagariensis TaxID=3068 RepID=D8TS65_VOLCA|nr:uncharacterized protein VOLCADRAFT_89567 [Volvox carteri f. nagariensis]EFJ49639.1 hypothetical protein VOLCADRAFT_89567 [Volvox carteri f. nagariensis]|eukprot:XP_002949146.1 hypothetical protein VOLCADRAFT_89567 [Volvox carteri f. nagariensis]
MAGILCTILTLLALGKAPEHCSVGHVPWFCHDLDCPPYEVTETLGKDVELRSYDAGVWMSTNLTGMDYDKAVRTGFMRLFAYISGANEGQQRIEMTAPVRVEMTPGAGPFCEDHYKVSFYVPFDLQDVPPLPLSKDLFVDPAPSVKYYVLSYGGRTNEKEIVDKAASLMQLLEDQGLTYDASTFFHAGYDSPFRLFNRHNEVWLRAV